MSDLIYLELRCRMRLSNIGSIRRAFAGFRASECGRGCSNRTLGPGSQLKPIIGPCDFDVSQMGIEDALHEIQMRLRRISDEACIPLDVETMHELSKTRGGISISLNNNIQTALRRCARNNSANVYLKHIGST